MRDTARHTIWPLIMGDDDGGDDGGDLFDIFGGGSWDPPADYVSAPAVSTVSTASWDPLIGELAGVPSLDGISYNPVTGELLGPDGNPLPQSMEASIRQAFGLDTRTAFSTAQMNAIAAGAAAESGPSGAPNAIGGNGPTESEIRQALSSVNQINAGAPATPGTLAQLEKTFMDPQVQAKLAVTGATGVLGALVSKLMSNPATAPNAQKLAAMFESMKSGGQTAFQNNLMKTYGAQFGPEQQVRSEALDQIQRVMHGQYSNPALEEQSRQNQETLANAAYRAGGANNLTESTTWQRAQMYKNLQDQIAKEADRKSTLTQLLPVPSTFGVGLSRNAYDMSGNPYGSQAASLLANLGSQEYADQSRANAALGSGIGSILNQAGQVVLGSMGGPNGASYGQNNPWDRNSGRSAFYEGYNLGRNPWASAG